MGLTKQYLRYVPSAVFGLIGSQKANVVFVRLRGGEQGRYVAVGACEHVFIWDVRKAEKVHNHSRKNWPIHIVLHFHRYTFSICKHAITHQESG